MILCNGGLLHLAVNNLKYREIVVFVLMFLLFLHAFNCNNKSNNNEMINTNNHLYNMQIKKELIKEESINYPDIKELKDIEKYVQEGHQPWRGDTLTVAKYYMPIKYKIDEKEFNLFKIKYEDNEEAIVELKKNNKIFEIHLIVPKGLTIWQLKKIKIYTNIIIQQPEDK